MADFPIIFDGNKIALPDGCNIGVQGEHNAVQLVITLPDSMVDGMDYHTVTLGGVRSAIITDAAENADGAYRSGNTIYMPLTAAYTKSCNADLTVTAYRQIGSVPTVVDKTPTVYGLRFSAGDAAEVDVPGGLVAQVAEIVKAQHTHPNKPTLDRLTEEGGTLYLDGKRLDGVIVWPIRKDPLIPAQPDGTLLYTVYGEDGLVNSDPYLVEIRGILYQKPAPWKPGQLWVCRGGIWYLLASDRKTVFDPSEVAQSGDDILGGIGEEDVYAPAPIPDEDTDDVVLLPMGEPLHLMIREDFASLQFPLLSGFVDGCEFSVNICDVENRGVNLYAGNGKIGIAHYYGSDEYKVTDNGITWVNRDGDVVSAPNLSDFSIYSFQISALDVTCTTIDEIKGNPEVLLLYKTLCRAINTSVENMGSVRIDPDVVEALSASGVRANRTYAVILDVESFSMPFDRASISCGDAYAVVYLDIAQDCDIAFDADLYVGGEAPNTKAGMHKLIYNVLPNGQISLGALDLEAIV